ncbi:MAG: hypothetical protein ING44_05280 [Telmatospirillum sp.]|nr:hypothetical protein [Telmatospirillum sp.]
MKDFRKRGILASASTTGSAKSKQRLVADGPNALPQTARRTALRIMADVLRVPDFGWMAA